MAGRGHDVINAFSRATLIGVMQYADRSTHYLLKGRSLARMSIELNYFSCPNWGLTNIDANDWVESGTISTLSPTLPLVASDCDNYFLLTLKDDWLPVSRRPLRLG